MVAGFHEASTVLLGRTRFRLPIALCVLLTCICQCRSFLAGCDAGIGSTLTEHDSSPTATSSMQRTGSSDDSSVRMRGPDVQPPNRPNPCTYWVVADRFLAGEYPLSSRHDEQEWRNRICQYLDVGITDFIDLTERGEKPSYESFLMEEARRKGIADVKYQRLAIPDFSVPSSTRMNEVLDSIDETIKAGRCAYIHCRGGIGRTGTTVGCFLVRHGNTGREALDEVNRLFQFSDRRFDSYRSPETDEQERFVLEWKDNDAAP